MTSREQTRKASIVVLTIGSPLAGLRVSFQRAFLPQTCELSVLVRTTIHEEHPRSLVFISFSGADRIVPRATEARLGTLRNRRRTAFLFVSASWRLHLQADWLFGLRIASSTLAKLMMLIRGVVIRRTRRYELSATEGVAVART
jgi:hypothetical protein